MPGIPKVEMDDIVYAAVSNVVKHHFALHEEIWHTLVYQPTELNLLDVTTTAFHRILTTFSLTYTRDALSDDLLRRLLTSTCYGSHHAVTLPEGAHLEQMVFNRQRESSTFDPSETTAQNETAYAIARSKMFAAAVATIVAFLRRLADAPFTIWTAQSVLDELTLFAASGAARRASEVVEATHLFETSFLSSHDPITDLVIQATRAATMHEEAWTAEEGDINRIEDFMICPTFRRPEDMGLGGFTIIPLL